MKRWIVQIDQNEIQAVEQLKKLGTIEKISIILNLFTIEGDYLIARKAQKIRGVLSVEEDSEGELMFA